MKNRAKWFIHTENNYENDSYTLTNVEGESGWNTDSGYPGYGLPKELAEWICDILNNSEKECRFINKGWGWKIDEKQSEMQ